MSNHGNGHSHDGGGRRPFSISTKKPVIPLAHVFERVNRQGKRYLAGRLGTGKILVVPTGEISKGEPVWQVFLGEWPRDAAEVHADLANVEER